MEYDEEVKVVRRLMVRDDYTKASELISDLFRQLGEIYREAYSCSEWPMAARLRLAADEADTQMTVLLRRILNFDAVINVVCGVHQVSRSLVTSSVRTRQVVNARHHLVWYLRSQGSKVWSYPLLGQKVGMRDHTTMLHSVAVAEKMLESNTIERVDCEVLRSYQHGTELIRPGDIMVAKRRPVALPTNEVCL